MSAHGLRGHHGPDRAERSGRSDRPEGTAGTAVAVMAGRATPSDIVAALRGSSIVTLSGFAAQVAVPSFLRPWVHFVSPSISGDDLQGVIAARSRRLRLMRWCALLCMHVLIAVTAAVAGLILGGQGEPEQVWRVVAVQPQAVQVRIGQGKQAPLLTVPVGATLPDGQTLTLVDPSRSMYAVGTTRVFLGQELAR